MEEEPQTPPGPPSPRNYTELNPWWRAAVQRMVRAMRDRYGQRLRMTIGNLAAEARQVRIDNGWFDYGEASEPAAVATPQAPRKRLPYRM